MVKLTVEINLEEGMTSDDVTSMLVDLAIRFNRFNGATLVADNSPGSVFVKATENRKRKRVGHWVLTEADPAE